MDWLSIILWGFVGTVVLSMVMRGSQELGFTRMDLPFMLGTMFTLDRDAAKLYGFLFHLVLGWLFSFIAALRTLAFRSRCPGQRPPGHPLLGPGGVTAGRAT